MTNLEKRNCPICSSDNSSLIFEQISAPLSGGNLSSFNQKICICHICGMIYVSEYLKDNDLSNYYSKMSAYEFTEYDYEFPEDHKKRSNEQFEYLSKYNNKFQSVIDIGCSLGYTLSLFKNTGSNVLGIEPSHILKRIAKEKYGVEVYTDFITEDFNINRKFELVILSHILEHLKKPNCIISNLKNIINSKSLVYIEVPSIEYFDERDLFQFSFEHINYFSFGSLSNFMYQNGFVLVDHIVYENNNNTAPHYPTLGTLWKQSENNIKPLINRFEHNFSLISKYIKLKNDFTNILKNSIVEIIAETKAFGIWGAGTLSAQLIAQTKIGKSENFKYIYDSDSKKIGLNMNGLTIKDANSLITDYNNNKIDKIIIGSWSSQNDIYNKLIKLGIDSKRIIRLFKY